VRRLESTLRPHDVLGRFGGEEFVVILPETGRSAALAAAERMLTTVAQRDGVLPVCTTSIGLTFWRPGDVKADNLVTRADSALYAAKANGRNRVEMA
jgi:diguanylate cyclase (GGDEF)-like protein